MATAVEAGRAAGGAERLVEVGAGQCGLPGARGKTVLDARRLDTRSPGSSPASRGFSFYCFRYRARYWSSAVRIRKELCWLYAAPWWPGGEIRRSASFPALVSALNSCIVFCGWTFSSRIEW